jgi:inner membrane protein
MPTILTHPAVPLAIGLGLGSNIITRRLLVAGVVASIVPDFDVIGIPFGVVSGTEFAHRGFTHSLAFAAGLALLGCLASRWLRASLPLIFAFLFAAAASHGVLDSFTNGGSGIAFLWPFSAERFFSPYRVIEVSPIGVSRFLSGRGVTVLASEMLWVWFPAIVLAVALATLRRQLSPGPSRNP